MRRTKQLAALALGAAALLGMSQAASAALLAEEQFSGYTADDPITGLNGGTGWAEAWQGSGGVSGLPFVNGTGLTFGTLATAGGSAQDDNSAGGMAKDRNYNASALSNGAGERWVSFLLNVDSLGAVDFTGSNQIYWGLNNSGGNATNAGAIAGTRITDFDASEGTFDMVANSGNSVSSALTLNLDQNYLIVLKYDNTDTNNADTVTLFVDPTIGGTPSGGVTLTGFNFAASRDYLQFAVNASGGVGNAFEGIFDEVRIGDTFADVTPVPEPATLILAAFGGVLILARRRRS